MIDITERLRFDATRCEIQFSKGVAGNIEEAVAEIERLRKIIKEAREVVAAHDVSQNDAEILRAYVVAFRSIKATLSEVDEQAAEAECETCRGDPEVCASVPGFRHCEKANRGEQAAQEGK